jgi:hypothetical protein
MPTPATRRKQMRPSSWPVQRGWGNRVLDNPGARRGREISAANFAWISPCQGSAGLGDAVLPIISEEEEEERLL